MKVIKSNKDRINDMGHLFRLDFNKDGAKIIEKWSTVPGPTYVEYVDFKTIEQDGKYYVFAATTNADFVGIEVGKNIIDEITKMNNAEKATKYINELFE